MANWAHFSQSPLHVENPLNDIVFKSLTLKTIHGRKIFHTWEETEKLVFENQWVELVLCNSLTPASFQYACMVGEVWKWACYSLNFIFNLLVVSRINTDVVMTHDFPLSQFEEVSYIMIKKVSDCSMQTSSLLDNF